MKTKKTLRILSALLVVMLMVSSLVMPSMATKAETQAYASEVSGAVKTVDYGRNGISTVEVTDTITLKSDPITIMVRLDEKTGYAKSGDLQIAASGLDQQLVALAQAESRVAATLGANIQVENRYTLLFNGFSFTGEAWMVEAINQMSGISAFEAPRFTMVEPETAEESVNLTPNTATSVVTTGTADAWELGYTGEGMLIGIIDSGIRQTHEAFSVAPENGKVNLAYLADVYARYGTRIHAGTAKDLNDIYYSEKLPFNWDYIDADAIPNHTNTDHGTHVAGIAAGDNGKDFKGIAPSAQIATFQVFDSQGGASFDTLMLALEDCVYLGVDTVNMSLGLPAWFTAYESLNSVLGDVYAALENAGISVAVAAGNDQYSSLTTNQSDFNGYENAWLAMNPDNGIVGAPATFPGSFSVGSAQNVHAVDGGYLVAYGKEYWPTTTNGWDAPFIGQLAEGEYDVVYVGIGAYEEVEAADVEGKIALVRKDVLMDLWMNAENPSLFGAIGMIVFGDYVVDNWSPIPYAQLTEAQGEEILANFSDGVHGKITVKHGFDYSMMTMATSSSWGTTADLRLTPEITAPGHYIFSTLGAEWYDDASYEGWSGTSMATPHIAAGLAIIKERLREEFPSATAAEINELAYAFMMSTANQITAFVRQQGAGLMNLENALTTQAYITVPGADRPKLELGENEDGKFTMTFEVNNFGDSDKTYTVSPRILTELVSDLEYSGNTTVSRDWAERTGFMVANPETVTVKTLSGQIKDVTDLCNVSGPEHITVPAGETVTVELTVTCGDELMGYFKENCPAGMYLEGWIRLLDQEENGINLSVPFLGFVGDWDYAPMFDLGFWYELPFGENNLSQYYTTQGTYIGYGIVDQGLGLNPYWDEKGETYLADRNAYSPNGDGFLDGVNNMDFSLMRNPKTLKLYVTDAEGNVLEVLHESSYNYRKEFYQTFVGLSFSNILFDYVGENVAENETVYFVLEAYLDHEGYSIEDNYNGRMVFPATKDLTAPAIRVVDGGIEIVDAQYTAYYAVYADEAKTELLYETGVFADERGAVELYETDREVLYVATADYACNEAFYMVADGMVYALEGDAVDMGGSDIFARTYINWADNAYQYGFATFNTETPNLIQPINEPGYEAVCGGNPFGIDLKSGAVNYDGSLILLGENRTLYFMDPETYELTEGPLLTYNGKAIGNIRGIATHPETYELYMLTKNGWLHKVDTETGECTRIWKLSSDWSWDPSMHSWAWTFIDGNTIAIYGHYGQMYIVNANDGTPIEQIDIDQQDNARSYISATGVASTCGNMVYDKKANCLYMFSNWSWIRYGRNGDCGYLAYDLDTRTISVHNTGELGGMLLHGLCMMDDLKPADFYVCMELIDAIGEVTLNSKEAIEAARAAYEALNDDEKSRVENYNQLLNAEKQYLTLVAEDAALQSAKAYALVAINNLKKNVTDECTLNVIEAAREAINNATTVEEVYAILDEVRNAVENGCVAGQYTDVSANAWYHESIEFVVANGLMNGISETIFAPNANMTRAQLVTVLYRMAGSPSVEDLNNPFTDVAADIWYTDAVIWAANEGIVNGVDETAFAPKANVTREQLVTILYRFFGEPEADTAVLEGYVDANAISDYAVNAMAWAVENGIINGMNDTTLAPQGNATRAQIATILMRYCEG